MNRLFSSEQVENNKEVKVEKLVLKVRKAIKEYDLEKLDTVVSELVWINSNLLLTHIDLLNKLLLNNFHKQHQYIARTIQDLKTPSSISFIDKVLESKFEGIPYSGSDSYSMAKWFSWALYEIGTKEAFKVLGKHASSEDKGIRYEMRYRLTKAKDAGKI